jgi:anti-sigma B factor antagonist
VPAWRVDTSPAEIAVEVLRFFRKIDDMPELKFNSDLIVSARSEGDVVLVRIRGDIDLHNSPDLRESLLDILEKNKPAKLILNLGEVPYMDSSAIAVLVESLKKLGRPRGKLCLTNLQPRVQSLLEIARLDSIFILAKDEADAMQK